ncbi:MAG: 2-dehydropantoate 2-reductase [Alphaproteobacteria bacterium]|nr:2-dehydropantoate 2-reductase [Alphaproteobacteria bacterium]
MTDFSKPVAAGRRLFIFRGDLSHRRARFNLAMRCSITCGDGHGLPSRTAHGLATNKWRNGMGKRIAIMGAGAVGAYAGAHMAQAGEDVTFIDPWPEHVVHMRTKGLHITGTTPEEEFTVSVKALHLTEAQQISKGAPVDIAFVCMKSYDTAWATMLISQYLAPGGFVVSLQNCMNEEQIAGIVGWGKTLGCIASSISVELYEPGHVHRGVKKGGQAHTVFRVGEVHGRVTDRASDVCKLVAYGDSAMVTNNLWGERWSKLVANSMANGLSASTGLSGNDMTANDTIRHFATKLGSEAIRVGQALGYALEEILHLPPETIARAGEGDAAALKIVDDQRFAESKKRSGNQRPSMGQDMVKGRRTEIEFLNGFVCRKGQEVGIPTRANRALTDIVKRVERGELKPDPKHITELRLN